MLNIIKTDNRLRKDSLADDKKPIVITINEFDEDDLGYFRQEMEKAISNEQMLIPLIVDSYGGAVYQLKGMVSIIRNAEKMGHIIATYTDSKAVSCGQFLVAFGTPGYRYASPTSWIMLHEAAMYTGGKTTEIESAFKSLKDLNDKTFRELAIHCGHNDKNFFIDYIASKRNADIWMTSKEAKKLKLVDHIGVPTLETRITVETNLVVR